MRKIIFILFNLIFFVFNLKSYQIASKSFQFLNLSPFARTASLGESFTALADDISTIYFNPAGISCLKNLELSLNSFFLFESINYYNFYAGKNFSFGGLALNLSFLNYGEIEKYLEGEKSEIFSPSDIVFQLGYSRKIGGILTGVSFKYISETLTEDYKSSGYGFDFGLLYPSFLKYLIKKSWSDTLNFGIVVQNIGKGPKFFTKNESLPLNFKAGLAYKYRFAVPVFHLRDLNFTLDFNMPSGSYSKIHFGVESWWYNFAETTVDFALRAGVKYPTDLGLLSSFTFGAGIRIFNFQIDYAFLNYGDLGIAHSVGILYRFGKIERPIEPKKEKIKKEVIEEFKEEMEEEIEEFEEEEFEEEFTE